MRSWQKNARYMIFMLIQHLCLYTSLGLSNHCTRKKRWQQTLQKKRIPSDSTHIVTTRTNTSGWTNFRDLLFEFDWQHMFLHYRTIEKNFYHQSKSTEAIFLQLEVTCYGCCCSEKIQSRLQHRIRKSKEIRRYMLLKKLHCPFQFTIRIPPQPKYMTRVRTAKGSLYL